MDEDEEYGYETEYAIIDISITKGESLTFTDGFQIKAVISISPAAMDSNTWNLTVLVERENEVTEDE